MKTEKVTITKIFTKEEMGKKGPYTKMALKTIEYGDRWISGFKNKGNSFWKEGDQVEIVIDRVAKGQNEYLNFKLPDINKENLGKLGEVLRIVTLIAEKNGIDVAPKAQTVGQPGQFVEPKKDEPNFDNVEYPEEEINLEDIPF